MQKFKLYDMYDKLIAEGPYEEIAAALQKWYDDLGDGIDYEPDIPIDAETLLYDIRDEEQSENGRLYCGPKGAPALEYYFTEA